MIGSRVILTLEDGVQTETEYLTLYYSLSDLFNKVSILSLYKLQAMGQDMDKLALTENERDFFNLEIKRATRDVFTNFSVMSKNITNALQFQYDDLSSTSDIDESSSVVYIIETPTYWDNNVTQVLDQKVEEAIISYILRTWYELKNLGDIYAIEKLKYEDLTTEIRSLVNLRTEQAKLKHRSF